MTASHTKRRTRKTNKGGGTRKSVKSASKSQTKMMSIVSKLMEILNCVKLYHWKTYSYAEHKATDELYSSLNTHIDKFVEIMLGKTQTRVHNVMIHCGEIETKEKFEQTIKIYIDYLQGFNNMFDATQDSDLLNIRDEIVGDLNQLMYLFTFK